MLKNIFIYLCVLVSAFAFSVFYYDWFSWYLFMLVLCVPLLSLVLSLPFMIVVSVRGVSVFTENELVAGIPLFIKVAPNKEKKIFCPLIKIKLKISNSFAGYEKTVKFLYSGFIEHPICIQTNSATNNCGLLEISAKYYKVYDMLGIFFIPVRLDYSTSVIVNPKPCKFSFEPDTLHNKVIGYKKKLNGFAEEYELRNYQMGDSLKNIHWKISARHNDLIVKEPSTPIFRQLVLAPKITSNPKENNITLGKLTHCADVLLKCNTDFYCAFKDGELYLIRDKSDMQKYFSLLYKNECSKEVVMTCGNQLIYRIAHDKEVVSEQ